MVQRGLWRVPAFMGSRLRPYYDDGHGIVLYHGDCREHRSWLDADVLIMDPPYGMAFESSWTIQKRPIAGDKDTVMREAALALWGDPRPAAVFGTWKVPRPVGTRHRLIWDKQDGSGAGMGDLDAIFGNSDEEIYLLGEWSRGERTRQPNVLRTSSGMAYLATSIGHPTPKPVDLMERLIRAAAPGVIADPFAGSGSTLVAAKNLGRRAIGIELDERSCEIAAERLRQEVLAL